MTVDFVDGGLWTHVRILPTGIVRVIQAGHPQMTRGRRECRALASPMARLQQVTQAAGTTGSAEHPAFPARWVTAYTCSPWCAGLLGHHPLAAHQRHET